MRAMGPVGLFIKQAAVEAGEVHASASTAATTTTAKRPPSISGGSKASAIDCGQPHKQTPGKASAPAATAGTGRDKRAYVTASTTLLTANGSNDAVEEVAIAALDYLIQQWAQKVEAAEESLLAQEGTASAAAVDSAPHAVVISSEQVLRGRYEALLNQERRRKADARAQEKAKAQEAAQYSALERTFPMVPS